MKPITQEKRLSRRIQVLSLFPEERLSPEAVSLLSVVLTELFRRRVSLMSLAGLRFSVKGISFSSRPSLCWTFCQVEDSSLSFLFRNPYRQLEKEFLLFLDEKPVLDEALLARAKREVLAVRPDSAELFLSFSKADFAPLCPDREKVLSFPLSELEASFARFLHRFSAFSFFFGSERNSPCWDFPKAERKKDVVVEDCPLPAECEDETLVLDLSHRPLESLADVDDFQLFYALLQREVSLLFRRMMLPSIRYGYHPLSSSRTLVLLTFAENNLSLLSNQLPFRKEKLPFLFDPRKEDFHRFVQDQILVQSDFSTFLSRLFDLSLWGVPNKDLLETRKAREDSSFYDSVVLSKMAMARKR